MHYHWLNKVVRVLNGSSEVIMWKGHELSQISMENTHCYTSKLGFQVAYKCSIYIDLHDFLVCLKGHLGWVTKSCKILRSQLFSVFIFSLLG